jgi:hypothetical protein
MEAKSMSLRKAKALDTAFYERVVAELEELVRMVRERPEMNHHAAERLQGVADDIRRDAGLEPPRPTRP